MRTFRGISLVASLCLALLAATSASASDGVVDEQWPTPNTPADGHYHLLVSDSTDFFSMFSKLDTNLGRESLLCSSTEDGDCAKAEAFGYNAVLPPCTSAEQTNCVAELAAIHADGSVDTAKFEYYTTPNHPNLYTGNAAMRLPQPASPGAWTLANTPHSVGTLYGLSVAVAGGVNRKVAVAPSTMTVTLSAVSRKNGNGGPTDRNGFENYLKCIQRINPMTGLRDVACGSGAEELGNYSCSFKMDTNGDCLLRQPFPKDVRFRISVRLADEPSGWLHGRLDDPQISIVKSSAGGTRLTVTAAPLAVPVFYAGGLYDQLPKTIQDYYAGCLSNNKCRVGSRQPRFGMDPLPVEQRNVMDQPWPYSDQARIGMLQWMEYAKDTAAAVPSTWTFRTLPLGDNQGQNACLKPDSTGVKGIVTTNATAYSDGPPTFTENQLTYNVTSPHFRPDGTTPFLGRYNLVLRSDIARCLYGFSSAPIQAKIEVIDAKGSQAVAVTSVAEANGWLSLAAAGFTFSNPTINVQLSQEKPAATTPKTTPKVTPKKQSITCVNARTKATKRVTASKCPVGWKKR